MSYDESDAARDDFIDALREELYPEHRDQAVAEFTTECLQRYYLSNRNALSRPLYFLREAHSLRAEHHAAALIFAFASIETLFKSSLLTPIVAGLVHNEVLARPLADSLLGRTTNLDRLKKLLFAIVSEHTGIDLRNFKRQGLRQTLWEEIKAVEATRVEIIHRADLSNENLFETAVSLAEFVLDNLLTEVLDYVGLHLHGDEICHVASKKICSEKARPSIPINAPVPSATLSELIRYVRSQEPDVASILLFPHVEPTLQLVEDHTLIISNIASMASRKYITDIFTKLASELYRRPISVECRD